MMLKLRQEHVAGSGGESAGSYTRGIPDNKGEAFEDDRRRVKGGLDLDSHHVSY